MFKRIVLMLFFVSMVSLTFTGCNEDESKETGITIDALQGRWVSVGVPDEYLYYLDIDGSLWTSDSPNEGMDSTGRSIEILDQYEGVNACVVQWSSNGNYEAVEWEFGDFSDEGELLIKYYGSYQDLEDVYNDLEVDSSAVLKRVSE